MPWRACGRRSLRYFAASCSESRSTVTGSLQQSRRKLNESRPKAMMESRGQARENDACHVAPWIQLVSDWDSDLSTTVRISALVVDAEHALIYVFKNNRTSCLWQSAICLCQMRSYDQLVLLLLRSVDGLSWPEKIAKKVVFPGPDYLFESSSQSVNEPLKIVEYQS